MLIFNQFFQNLILNMNIKKEKKKSEAFTFFFLHEFKFGYYVSNCCDWTCWFHKFFWRGIWILKIKRVEMHVQLSKIQLALVNRLCPILLHDNVCPHVGRITYQILIDLEYNLLPHPPYSPELSHYNYHFFQASGHCFTSKNTPFQRRSKNCI